MIRSFRDKDTAQLFDRESFVSGDPMFRVWGSENCGCSMQQCPWRTSSPRLGNRLEKLSENRAGRWSIRINRQWRICFVWKGSDACEVEIVDYH